MFKTFVKHSGVFKIFIQNTFKKPLNSQKSFYDCGVDTNFNFFCLLNIVCIFKTIIF